jgi:hypothetical protein
VAGILGVYALYQLTLVLGAPLGLAAWGGTHTTLPAALRVGSLVTILVYLVCAALVLRRVGYRVNWISRTAALRGTWAVAIILTLSAILNLASDSAWERLLNGPLTLALASLCFFVAKRAGEIE